MGVPKLNITFHAAAERTAYKVTHGTVALILQEAASVSNSDILDKLHELNRENDIPDGLSDESKDYIKRAFIGGVYKPAKVWAYIATAPASSEHEEDMATAYEAALAALSRIDFDWLTIKTADSGVAAIVKEWIDTQRSNGAWCKAIIPSETAADFDDEAIVNFVAKTITVADGTYDAAAYSSRIAGIIAGTPLSASVTHHILPEVSDVYRYLSAEQDQLVDDGALILIYDGVKVKIARGVTSLTTTAGKIASLKKIKIIDALDSISRDLKLLCSDNYVGKYTNTYDNKCLLLTAIKSYLAGLEQQGVIQEGSSKVELDIAAINDYLTESGVDTSDMTEQDLKVADTGSEVFIRASFKVYDAIEDITIDIEV